MLVPVLVAAASVGANVHLPPPDTLDLADELGVGWVRIDFNWDLAEPVNGSYDWAPFDAVIDGAAARGLNVFATIGYGPAWASISGNRDGGSTSNDVPDPAEYQQFVTDAAARYVGKVQAWGTWNEPNLGDFFEGTREEWLANAFIPAVDGIRAGCPSCLVVGPELASIGDQYAVYFEAALAARGGDLDVVSFHIYSSFPEDDSEAGVTKDSFYNKLDAHRIVEVGGFVVYEGPLSAREVMVAQGYGALPLWITETGNQAVVGDAASLEDQRRYVNRVLDAMEARAWWGATMFYELTEEHPGGLWPDIHWGLALRVADPDGSYADNFERKPAFDDLAARLATAPPGPDAGPVPGDPDAGPPPGGPDAAPGASDAAPPGAADAAPGAGGDVDGAGCGCRAGGGQAGGGSLGALLLMAALLLTRRGAAA